VGKHNFITHYSKKSTTKTGFTLVEIIVVIAVIAIVAGIVILGYGTWRKDLAANQLKSDLKAVAGAMENARNFGTVYPSTIPTNFEASEDVTLTYVRGNGTTYCIQAVSTLDSSVLYRYDVAEKKEPQSGPCT
jgi:prepilin-type N-terminal cleavage/methylation domain-containing protein